MLAKGSAAAVAISSSSPAAALLLFKPAAAAPAAASCRSISAVPRLTDITTCTQPGKELTLVVTTCSCD
jgi:hypothetical protein